MCASDSSQSLVAVNQGFEVSFDASNLIVLLAYVVERQVDDKSRLADRFKYLNDLPDRVLNHCRKKAIAGNVDYAGPTVRHSRLAYLWKIGSEKRFAATNRDPERASTQGLEDLGELVRRQILLSRSSFILPDEAGSAPRIAYVINAYRDIHWTKFGVS